MHIHKHYIMLGAYTHILYCYRILWEKVPHFSSKPCKNNCIKYLQEKSAVFSLSFDRLLPVYGCLHCLQIQLIGIKINF